MGVYSTTNLVEIRLCLEGLIVQFSGQVGQKNLIIDRFAGNTFFFAR
jgi:hypothetical protein